MITITLFSVFVTVICLLLAGYMAFRDGKRRKILSRIDMTIMEITVPGCECICFYMHPDRAEAARCIIGQEYEIKQLVPDYKDNLSLYSEKGVFILEQESINCRIRITDKGTMPSGDPMLQGELIRIKP